MSDPSGPSDGPVMSVTSCPRSCWPSQESSVFSCAPPMIRRVIMWTIRIDLRHYTTMDAPAVISSPALQSLEPTILTCMRCGYDLRGQDEKGRCPECGLSVFWSCRAPEQISQYPPA